MDALSSVRIGDTVIAALTVTEPEPTLPTGWVLLGVLPTATGSLDYRVARQAANIGLRELARRTGINAGRLSIIERGVAPSDDEARLIHAALGGSTDGEAQHGASAQ